MIALEPHQLAAADPVVSPLFLNPKSRISNHFNAFQTLGHFSHARPFVFNSFRTLSSKNTRGGYPLLNLRTKNEACIH
jgi:hypothetical protein